MRFSTWKYVVEKKLAIGQTLYESKMRPKSSYIICQPQFACHIACSTYVVEVLCDQGQGLVLQKAHQDQEHGLIEQRPHRDAVGKPLPEYVPPVPDPDILLHHLLVLSIILECDALLLFSSTRRAFLLHSLPARKGALQPTLPMEVYGCGEHDHEGELKEEDAVEYEGLGFVPCFEALRDDVGAGVDCERRETGNCNWWKLHHYSL